jgi:hypothetical protein
LNHEIAVMRMWHTTDNPVDASETDACVRGIAGAAPLAEL